MVLLKIFSVLMFSFLYSYCLQIWSLNSVLDFVNVLCQTIFISNLLFNDVSISSVVSSLSEVVFYLLYSVGEASVWILLVYLNFSFPNFSQFSFICWFYFHFQVLKSFINFLTLFALNSIDFFKDLYHIHRGSFFFLVVQLGWNIKGLVW